jgi:hypothetical protein
LTVFYVRHYAYGTYFSPTIYVHRVVLENGITVSTKQVTWLLVSAKVIFKLELKSSF